MTEFTVELRHRCRNQHCRMKLTAPVENQHQAFCTKGCHGSFYLKRCLVCEREKPVGSTARRKLCRRPKCESQYRQNGVRYSFPGGGSAPAANEPRKPTKSGIKSADKADRPWRIVAAPNLTAGQLHAATVPDGPDNTWEARNRAALREHFRKSDCLIGPGDPPINLLGGYTFSNAPALPVRAAPQSEGAPSDWKPRLPSDHTTLPDLSIPDFLQRETVSPVQSGTPVEVAA